MSFLSIFIYLLGAIFFLLFSSDVTVTLKGKSSTKCADKIR